MASLPSSRTDGEPSEDNKGGRRKWAMVTASVRGANAVAFTVGVLMLVAACGSSSQTPTAGPTTLATVTSPATRSTPASAPTAPVPTSLAGRVVDRLPTSRRIVALTFDAGANGDGVKAILATLA